MGLIIAGERSGVGKTTITLALLAYLARQGKKVQSFKVGPDYIDPMFHTHITGKPCRNLDPVLTSPDYVKTCYARHSQGVEFSVVEGVMGLFDGIPFPPSSPLPNFASTAHLAKLLGLPVLLVIDCSALSGSVAAIVHGYTHFDPDVKLAGVVFNRVGSDRHFHLLKNALDPLQIPLLGVFYRNDSISIPDRHLGLVPTDELEGLHPLFEHLATLAKESFHWEKLLPLLKSEPASLPSPPPPSPKIGRIAVARDRAFNFYYQDNLELLQQYGAELVFWSPLTDPKLPPNTQGLYFGGGFPEMFAPQLSANTQGRLAVYHAIKQGMSTYAECGGLMYLCQNLVDFDGKTWEMVGILPTTTLMGKRLTLGYRQATVQQTTPFVQTGETFWGHEFHRSQLTQPPTTPLYHTQSYRPQSPQQKEGWHTDNVHASYLHLHWGNIHTFPQRFCSLLTVNG